MDTTNTNTVHDGYLPMHGYNIHCLKTTQISPLALRAHLLFFDGTDTSPVVTVADVAKVTVEVQYIRVAAVAAVEHTAPVAAVTARVAG